MTGRTLFLAAVIVFANTGSALKAQEHKSTSPSATQAISNRPESARRSGNEPIKLTHDEIVKWMNAYFAEYNASAQNAKTVHRMDTYFAPNFTFIPYMYVFGGPQHAITGREAFYTMLTGHPADYERFIVHDVFVDEKKMVAVAFLEATIFETGTNRVKVKKNYLPLYELKLDDKGALKIATVRFFWEALPPEVDGAAYSVDKSKWGIRR
ncbi:MAG TPA: nuclear transport factor 2 family protein [Acidobacteriota bacterium]|nr:nuclear transport factor 2 family protein [Acidobacteriota bacterium]